MKMFGTQLRSFERKKKKSDLTLVELDQKLRKKGDQTSAVSDTSANFSFSPLFMKNPSTVVPKY